MFRLSWQANADLQAIADYLGVKSPVAAAQVLDALLATFELLAKNPRLGEPRDDLHPGIRMFVPDSPADKVQNSANIKPTGSFLVVSIELASSARHAILET